MPSATPDTFRATFRAFSDPEIYPSSLISFYLELAYIMLPAPRWMKLWDYGAQLFVAHHLALEAKAQREAEAGGIPGSTIGPVGSKSAGPVSLSMDTNVAAEAGAGFWNLTTYGMRFYRLVRLVGIGGIQLGIGGIYGSFIVSVPPAKIEELIGFSGVPLFGGLIGSTIPEAPVEEIG